MLTTSHRLINGDARDLSFLDDGSVHLVVTSPPYWNLKRYQENPDQLGHIQDYEAFLSELEKVWSTLGGQLSSELILALFSPVLAKPQPDWPRHTHLTGFPFLDQADLIPPPGLREFLDSGPAPVVFTLGSAAVLCADNFYRESAAAARQIGRRALLLVGKETRNELPGSMTPDIAAFDYAPFSEVFPRACAIVHHGGIGSTGQALRAGKPMMVVPSSHDQPDNAARLVRLGVARTIPSHRYTARRAADLLQRLLSDPRYADAAAEIGRQVQSEDGVASACNLLEELLAARAPSTAGRVEL